MNRLRSNRIDLAPWLGALSLVFTLPVAAKEPGTNAAKAAMETVVVYGEQGETSTAAKLDLTIFETPQTVSVISRPQIEDFALADINELLRYAPGVTVENVETDRTYYTARGFDIVNFQYDGVGVPFSSGLADGDQDTAIFEQVEVVKGAAGLITGLANPSATVNFIRKRPTAEPAASVKLTVGEENRLRVEGDLSGSFTPDLRGRVVVAGETTDSYLDRLEEDNQVFYGVLAHDLSDATQLTLGYSLNRNKVNGSLSGALPLYYSDGSQTDYDVSTSTATDWAYRDIDRSQAFIELKHALSDQWMLNAIYTYTDFDMTSDLFYTYGTPDAATELGLTGLPNGYDATERDRVIDISVNGRFTLLGREHDVVFGYNHAAIDLHGQTRYPTSDRYPVLGSDWAQGNYPRPTMIVLDTFNDAHEDEQSHTSYYLASRLHFSDQLALLLGARAMTVKQGGYNYGVVAGTKADEVVPYAGVTYNLLDTLMLYASYSEVFTPQNTVDPTFHPTGVAKGDNSEIGLKVEMNDGLAVATLALFQANQKNLAEFFGRVSGTNTYLGRDYESEGVEAEITGALTQDINVSLGYTWVDIVDEEGDDVRTYVPRNQVKLAAAYHLPMVPKMTLGASLRWQESIDIEPAAGVRIEQESYAVVDAFARYDITNNLSTTLNVNNLTDEKYFASLYWTQAYYAPPRQIEASVTWRY